MIKKIIPSSLWRQARALRAKIVPALFRSRWVNHRYGDSEFKVWITDPVARDWYDADHDSLVEIRFFRSLGPSRGLRPGSLVFEIGAHQGVVAMQLARQIQPGGRVVALEATRRNADVARANFKANDLGCAITIIHAAAGSSDGHIDFDNNFNGQVTRSRSNLDLAASQVMMRSLDSLAAEFGEPDVAYIDVEGFEGQVLQGAKKLLADARTSFFVEIHPRTELAKFGTDASTIIAAFPPASYALFACDPFVSGAEFAPLSECAHLIGSGRKFYVAAVAGDIRSAGAILSSA